MTRKEATVAERQAALRAAEINLAYTDIVSPVDGIIVSRNAQIGRPVAPGSKAPLFAVASDLSLVRVDANVSAKDIGEVKLGDKATLTAGPLVDHPFTGVVTQIGESPRTVDDATAYDVTISAPNPDLSLKPGMAAAVRIVVDRRDDVLRAPDETLRYSPRDLAALRGVSGPKAPPDGWSQIWILRDGSPTGVAVQLGLDDGAYTEIVKGDLRRGDALIIGENGGVSK